MAYIVFVNPSIPSRKQACRSKPWSRRRAFARLRQHPYGAFRALPIALAPAWVERLLHLYGGERHGRALGNGAGRRVLSGVAFLILTLLGIRQLIFQAIPHELYAAVAAGIGLFIALIGLRTRASSWPAATLVTPGNLRDPSTLVALAGLLIIAARDGLERAAAMLIAFCPPRC